MKVEPAAETFATFSPSTLLAAHHGERTAAALRWTD